MPLYEYRCKSCGERTEVLQHLNEPPMRFCPRCGGAVEKMLSAPALQFKGSGFYVNDYARGGAADRSTELAAKNASVSSSKSADKPTTKNDSASSSKTTEKAASTPREHKKAS